MSWKPNSYSHLTMHEQIIDWVKSRIDKGEWTVGTKLPPQRSLASQFNVNRSTVQLALDELKANGLLHTKKGSGVFVANNSWSILLNNNQPNWHRHIESSIHKPNYHTIQLINEYEQQEDVIRLGTGELSPDLLPTEQIRDSLSDIQLESKAIGYSSPLGSEKLRNVLCSYLKKRNIHTEPDNILIVSGALQALQLIAFGLLKPGSVVFQEEPSYLNSIHPFQSSGMHVTSIKKGLNLKDALKEQKRNGQSLYYSVPTLHNPTGRNWMLEEKEKLYEICKELQIPIIEDDVYYELLFDEAYPAIKSFDNTGQVLYLGSVSKTLSPGLRIGWVVAPTPVIRHLADIKMQTDYGSSAFSQEIVAHWISSGMYEAHISKLRAQLKERAIFTETLLEENFKSIATWEKSEGGFYIWLKLNEPVVNKALFLNLINRKILINPGYIYMPADMHHMRLSYAYASLEDIEKGLIALKEEIS